MARSRGIGGGTGRRHGARRWLLPLLIAAAGAAAGAAITALAPLAWHLVLGPPDPSAVTSVMYEEAAAGRAHELDTISRIYAPGAVVTDAGGCQGQSTTWTGPTEIAERYRALPAFSSLQHVDAHVVWEPGDIRPDRADVTSRTIGVIDAGGESARKPQFIVGREQWTFQLENGRWLITSFTYNLCPP